MEEDKVNTNFHKLVLADVNTNPENIVIGARAFSDDPEVAAPMVVLSHAAAVARHEVR